MDMNMHTRGELRIRSACKLWVLALGIMAVSSCIGERPRRCETQRDCGGENSVCSTRGFCQNECSQDADCPCSSYCAIGCGICLRSDNTGAATCFAGENGLSAPDILGVCSSSIRQAAPQPADAGVCMAPPLSLTCAARVTEVASRDAGSQPQPSIPTPQLPMPLPPAPDAGDAGGVQ
jgi:hypothetical protein